MKMLEDKIYVHQRGEAFKDRRFRALYPHGEDIYVGVARTKEEAVKNLKEGFYDKDKTAITHKNFPCGCTEHCVHCEEISRHQDFWGREIEKYGFEKSREMYEADRGRI